MLRITLALMFLFFVNMASAQIDQDGHITTLAARVIPVHQTCFEEKCPSHDAIVFVHGIYGDGDTFKNGAFDWPQELPTQVRGSSIDVFRIDYRTTLLAWLKRDVATMDEVTYSIFKALYPDQPSNLILVPDRYRSVNFIAHSLGGNVVSALLHTVKTELGHAERARYGFVITLGTPINGAQIAQVAGVAKRALGMETDPLLSSMARDNTFLRMLNLWRRSENIKATRFDCRPVHLYVAIEGARTYGIRVVPREAALPFFRNYAQGVEYFDRYNHFRIAKPINRNDELYKWAGTIIDAEMERLSQWRPSQELCERVF